MLIPVAALVLFSILGAIQTNAQPDSDLAAKNAWAGGPWYFNRNDPALAVRRRDGLRYVPLILFVTFRWIL